ncbi:hypothetical protein M2189_005509 [Bradyrhizobium japonicum]|nr:hypothetical protein [Bradyrhizobium japonicum]MCS3962306.1 hypothetical protein [Bradyrhizobium japonicum]MCS3990705.1 hypothetical protein [Bradyrhizobium japonicum]MCS3994623.1 hypothetical protein [Bradyrhizobium japonicum]MCS4014483.1 hypothetical protein [Bradyrhizobium japonicum]
MDVGRYVDLADFAENAFQFAAGCQLRRLLLKAHFLGG